MRPRRRPATCRIRPLPRRDPDPQEENDPMASLIESVRKLHGPHLVAHENGYDVDVTCEECRRLRLEALDQAAGQGEGVTYRAEGGRVPRPRPTRAGGGNTEGDGREER